MKLVIDIPEEVKYKVHAYGLSLSPSDKEQLINAIVNGTPLPKGHGRLIDTDDLVSKAHEEAQGMTNNNFGVEVEWLTDKMPTIIEADKEGSGDA